jgi:hypothetical protein
MFMLATNTVGQPLRLLQFSRYPNSNNAASAASLCSARHAPFTEMFDARELRRISQRRRSTTAAQPDFARKPTAAV